jgi:hypothetical protein
VSPLSRDFTAKVGAAGRVRTSLSARGPHPRSRVSLAWLAPRSRRRSTLDLEG